MRFTDRTLKRRFLSSLENLPKGEFTLRTPEGEVYHFGSGGPSAEMQINDWAAVSAMASHGQVGLGEAYVQGLWDSPSVEAMMALAIQNRDTLDQFDHASPWQKIKFQMVDRVLRANNRKGSSRNIKAHYDVGNEFYSLWLDDGMTYSSGIFTGKDDDLAQAQSRKNARVLSKLKDGDSILEIGCGWGGFAECASEAGHDVTGITLSRNQKAYADSRLDGRAKIELRDYRDVSDRYDNIVSIEMIEAVGERYWPRYFSQIKQSLNDGGRALLQVIVVADSYFETYRRSSDFIRQYVFPGGMLLSNSALSEQSDKAGLKIRDNFAFGQDYAQTCRIWSQRLQANRQRILGLGYDDSFFRNWNYYLDICAASFAVGHTDVVQVELSHA